jgi:hypothetical protein
MLEMIFLHKFAAWPGSISEKAESENLLAQSL